MNLNCIALWGENRRILSLVQEVILFFLFFGHRGETSSALFHKGSFGPLQFWPSKNNVARCYWRRVEHYGQANAAAQVKTCFVLRSATKMSLAFYAVISASQHI